MHDLNLDDMMMPSLTPPMPPTGKLKVQFQMSEDRTSLTVIIIEVLFISSIFVTGIKTMTLC